MATQNLIAKSTKLSAQATAFLVAIAMMLSMGSSEARAGECKTVRGHFISQQMVIGGTCTSPVFCVSGEAIGGLQGDFVATVTSLVPSPDFGVTAIAFFTADLLLHTKDGDLAIKEAGAFNTDGGGDLGDVGTIECTTIIGCTGKWTGAIGRLRIAGTLPFVERSDVDYEGEICLLEE